MPDNRPSSIALLVIRMLSPPPMAIVMGFVYIHSPLVYTIGTGLRGALNTNEKKLDPHRTV